MIYILFIFCAWFVFALFNDGVNTLFLMFLCVVCFFIGAHFYQGIIKDDLSTKGAIEFSGSRYECKQSSEDVKND